MFRSLVPGNSDTKILVCQLHKNFVLIGVEQAIPPGAPE
jgi:hypothetical protein